MKSLNYLNLFEDNNKILESNKALFIQVKKHKRIEERPLLDQIENGVFDRYSTYLEQQKNLSSITTVNDYKDYEDIMRNSYKNSKFFNIERKKIFDSLPNGRKTICPYCLLSDSSTLDHYFPETFYVEYIIFTPNLIPCCEKCNELKKTSIRRTIHFYFDEISQETYLNITIRVNSCIPVIYISLAPNTPNLIKNHFDQLQLIDRYKEKASDELTQILGMLKRACLANQYDECLEMFKYNIDYLKNTFGTNYWKACLLEAVLKSRKELLEAITYGTI